jgi:hypothetical protein
MQRIAAIYSLSKKYRFGFIHNEILCIDGNPGDGFTSNHEKMEFTHRLNRYIDFTSHQCQHDEHIIRAFPFHKIFRWRIGIRLWTITEKIKSWRKKEKILYLLGNPYYFIERAPNTYRYFIRDFGGLIEESIDANIHVHFHLVLGKASPTQLESRYTPVSNYLSLAIEFEKTINALDKTMVLTIHTDAPKVKGNWASPTEISEKTKALYYESSLIDSSGKLRLNGVDLEALFSNVRNLIILRDIDPITAWDEMRRAHILVIGKSSFSFFAALLNKSAIVLSPRFQHRIPKNWHYWELGKPLGRQIIGDVTNKLSAKSIHNINLTGMN